MKKIIQSIGIALGATQLVLAASPGIYVGAGAGYGILRTPDNNMFAGTTNTYKRGGISGRGFVGFNFNPCLGIEIGYARYNRSIYTGAIGNTQSTLKYYSYTADLVAKAYLPLGGMNQFNVYGLLGAARVNESIVFNDQGIAISSQYATPNDGTTHARKTRPIYGAGASYNLSYHLVTNIEYTQIHALGKFSGNANAIPYTDLLTLNLAYNFG